MVTPASPLCREVLGKPSPLLILHPPPPPPGIQAQEHRAQRCFWKGFLQTRGKRCLILSGLQAQAPPRNSMSQNVHPPGFNTGSGQTLLAETRPDLNPPSHPHFWIAVTRSPLLRARLQGLRSKKQTTPDTPTHTRPEYRRFLLRPRSGKLTAAQMQREGDVHKTNRGSKTAGRSQEKRLSLPLPSHRGPRILRGGARGASRRVLPPHGGPAASALTSWKPGNPQA